MTTHEPTPPSPAGACRVEAAQRYVATVHAALADIRNQLPTGFAPVEQAQEQQIVQAAARLLECAEQLDRDGLVVLGSTKQSRPHPMLTLERQLRTEITKTLNDLSFRSRNRAMFEVARELTIDHDDDRDAEAASEDPA